MLGVVGLKCYVSLQIKEFRLKANYEEANNGVSGSDCDEKLQKKLERAKEQLGDHTNLFLNKKTVGKNKHFPDTILLLTH